MARIIDWRNQDAEVWADLTFRAGDDFWGENKWALEVYDTKCQHPPVGGGAGDSTEEPSRHVVVIVTMFGLRLDVLVCVPLREPRERRAYLSGSLYI